MTTVTSWETLLEVAHPLACEKGWWDNPDRPIDEQVANFHAEISEAWEEFRAGRIEMWYSHEGRAVVADGRAPDGCPLLHRVPVKPEGFWVEIADLLVRVADTCGRYGLVSPVSQKPAAGAIFAPELVTRLHWLIADSLAWLQAEDWASSMESVAEIVQLCEVAARGGNVDLWPIVNEKLAYNRTRPHRHGGKVA